MENEITLKVNNDLTLIQNRDGLTFGTDAYLLAAYTAGGSKKVCVDLGSGTGIIPLLCASKNKFKKIYAVEIQPSFAKLIARNTDINGLDGKITPVCADVKDLTAALFGGEVDTVTTNPPYMKADSGKRNEHDEKFIARHEVCGDIGDFCAAACRILKHGGNFYTVWRPDRLCDLLCALRNNRIEPKLITFVHATPESQPSMVLVRSKRARHRVARSLDRYFCTKTPRTHAKTFFPPMQRQYTPTAHLSHLHNNGDLYGKYETSIKLRAPRR